MQYKRKRRTQKLYGLAMILISIFIVILASQGTTIEERDCTAVLLTAPMGLWMLFSKSILIV
jgi:predicted branched-subunit amino acid permease